MDVINLQEQFGDRYKVVHEESYCAERGERAYAKDPWLMILLCEHGHFYPHGGKQLGFATNKAGSIGKQVIALDFVRVVQDGSDGVNVVFPVTRFGEVAAIVKPRRRRRSPCSPPTWNTPR